MRAETALGMASYLLGVADPCEAADPGEIVIEAGVIRSLQKDLLQLEALTCALMQDAGMSWDAIASYYGVSRQSLHRRLAAASDKALQQAQDEPAVVEENLREDLGHAVTMVKHLARKIRPEIEQAAQVWRERRRQPGWWHL
ncbi:hypothetical protein [Actinomadura sp. NPDC048394]|uniref:hypothetical protein n=1 Tax=Actinomadura sp. NPDC048394 TaxID=3158223 RepID=UPI0033E3E7B1